MKVVYSATHLRHNTPFVTWVGKEIPADELPARIEIVRDTLAGKGHQVVESRAHDDTILDMVHDPEMTAYMSTAVEEWNAAGYPDMVGQTQVTSYAFPHPGMLRGEPLKRPVSRGALAGVWAMDTTTQIGDGTFEAARGAVDVAQTTAELLLEGEESAYGACRPPGHHVGRNFFGGSCYLNNAAIAAQTLRIGGFGKVAIVDVDAHHGNGTQEIFYDRADVFYGSVHVDPGAGWFPHFVGFADETGVGAGAGFNLNAPIAPGEGDRGWLVGVRAVIDAVTAFEPDAIVVSLGVDAGASDENSPLLVTEDGYREAGLLIAGLDRPTALIQEGGYDLNTIGGLVSAALDGFG